jgi:endonuclease/exonuclease/phosphatase family metal-dependent hydrolase
MKRAFSNIATFLILAFLFAGSCDSGRVPNGETVSTIIMASFNTLHLGWDNGKDLDKLAEVLVSYDVIGLQEVMNEDTLKKVRDILAEKTKATWQYVISARSLGRSTYREYYAVLYRSDRTTYTSNSAEIWNDEGDLFEREPFFASFKSKNFDYTIVVMHSDFDSNKEVMRKEARLLYTVYSRVQDRNPNEEDIILMGDFNLSANDVGWDSLKTMSTMTNLIPGATLTTLSTSGGLSSAYDNIWIRTQFTGNEFTDTSKADYYYTLMFSGSANPGLEARNRISDHVPVWAKFRVDKADDD